MVDLGYYKWYKSQTRDDVPMKTLAARGVDYEIPQQLENETKHSIDAF